MVVKLGDDLSKSRIKGAVSAHEVLAPSAHFLMADPPEGFSVRNFQIQTAKLAAMSDIVIYAEDDDSHSGLVELANQFAMANENGSPRGATDVQHLHSCRLVILPYSPHSWTVN